MYKRITLDKLKIGKSAKVIKINNTGSIRRRLLDIGIIPNTYIKTIYKSIFNDPVAYLVRDNLIAIRKCDSKYILVEELNV